jgi:hypothetical protein
MTEDEARQRWCPFARVSRDHAATSPAVNRWDSGTPEPRWGPHCACIASYCMAWRWHYSPHGQRLPDGHCGLVGEE